MKVFIALCLLAVSMAVPKVAFPNADLIRNSKLGIKHPSQKLIEEARAGESRIVGGTNVDIDDHHWQASLQNRNSHICGASYIGGNWVVTAAHCVDGLRRRDISVKFGSNYHNTGGETIRLTQFKMHENYNKGYPGTFPYDIALLQLEKPPTMATKITIAGENQAFDGENCVITGWGLTSGGGYLSGHLKGVNMTVLTNNECQTRWNDIGALIIESHVCVYQSGKSSCNGDSGGPLVCGNTLVGATSWGINTCENYPSVYTRLSSFREWIRDISGI